MSMYLAGGRLIDIFLNKALKKGKLRPEVQSLTPLTLILYYSGQEKYPFRIPVIKKVPL